MFNRQLIGLCFLSVFITACSSNYQAKNVTQSGGGYQETLLNTGKPARFMLVYHGSINAERKLNTQYWHQRANELCPQGYRVLDHSQYIVEGVMQSKTSGNMVALAERSPVDDGEIICQ